MYLYQYYMLYICIIDNTSVYINKYVHELQVSDVVARGLDVPSIDAVFHAELPSSASHYAHRAGRTGRMGAPGVYRIAVLLWYKRVWYSTVPRCWAAGYQRG